MTPETPLAPGIYRMTSNLDFDDIDMYEGRWPIPHGLALHAYVVRGEKTAVIDPYCEGGYGLEEVAEDLEVIGLTWNDVDFVALTSPPAELAALERELAALPKPPRLLKGKPGEAIDLGGGKQLRFLAGMLLEPQSGVLFSGTQWAGFGAVEDTVLSTEANGTEARFYDDEALRWFVTHPDSCPPPPAGVSFVAPAHGLLWPNPAALFDRAAAWQSWTADAEDEITLVWSAARDQDAVVDDLIGGLQGAGIDLGIFRVPDDDASFVAAAIRRSSGVVVGPGVDEALLTGLQKRVWRVTETQNLRTLAQEFAKSVLNP